MADYSTFTYIVAQFKLFDYNRAIPPLNVKSESFNIVLEELSKSSNHCGLFVETLNYYGKDGYKFVEFTGFRTSAVGGGNPGYSVDSAYAILERMEPIAPSALSRFREEVDAKIREVTSQEITKAADETKISVLNILEKIPQSILTHEYSLALQSQIEANLKEQMEKMVEIIRLEIDKKLKSE